MPVSRTPSKRRYSPLAITGVLGAALLAGVFFMHHGDAKDSPQKQAAMPPVPVTTQTVSAGQVMVWSEFSGKLTAVDAADIRPEVSGRITEIRFRDGQEVKKGQILVVIDPRPFEANLAKAESNLTSAKSNSTFANQEIERARKLVRTHVVARQAVEQKTAAAQVATAAIASAEAEARQARLDVEHAYVKAPISGRISRAEITVGNVVQAGGNAPVLTSIVARQAVYVDFDVDEPTYLEAVRSDAGQSGGERSIPVRLKLRGDTTPYDGHILAFDNKISNTSGTIRARALFENKDNALIPGMFASVQMGLDAKAGTILIPERAIGTDQDKRYVYVIGDANKVVYREVKLGSSMEQQRIVLSGLSAGEKIIIDGVQHVQPGAVVEPKEAAAETGGKDS